MGEKKDLEVISGDGSNLDISPVHDNINNIRPSTNKKPSDVVIPKETHEPSKNSDKK